MKVCVVSSTVFAVPLNGYGGLEYIAWQQAEGLAAKGHEVSLIAPEGSRCDKATVIPCGPPGAWDERRAFQHYHEVLPKFDVIIDHSWNKWAYIAKAEGRLPAPVLGVTHAPVNTMYQSLPPGVDKPCFVCISQDQANHFEALFSHEARVCHNGIDLDFYRPMGVPRSGRFLFLARFSTIKGPDLAIEAARKAGVGLDLVGDTSITNEPDFLKLCQNKAQEANIQWVTRNPVDVYGPSIRLVGPASRGECVWWFSQAHCLLHPNQRFREPFGLAPVEAMACGCPVIAWDNGAMRETVKNGETGRLVKSLDGLVSAMTDIDAGVVFRNRERCREWASQFSIQRMVDRMEELCQEAVEGGGW